MEDYIQSQINEEANIWSLMPKISMDYKDEFEVIHTPFGRIKIWSNHKEANYYYHNDILRKKRKYEESDLMKLFKAFWNSNNLRIEQFRKEWNKAMKNYSNQCACDDYYGTCIPHQLEWNYNA